MDRARALETFQQLAAAGRLDNGTADGALLIAAHSDPAVDIERESDLLDQIAKGLRPSIQDDASPITNLNLLTEFLADEIGFRGNEADYYDPRNSLLHEVLRRRVGIPISLAVIYLEVGQRAGVPLYGVGMPGHFLIRHREDQTLFADPFNRGILLSPAECAEKLKQISKSVRWHPSFLDPTPPRQILARMLRNLSAIRTRRNELQLATETLTMLIALEPHEPGHRRDRGVLHYKLGEEEPALRDLKSYLTDREAAPDAWHIRKLMETLRGA